MSPRATQETTWTKVDHYLSEKLIPADPILDQTLRANSAARLPSIDVSPLQGKFLHLLARIANARRILEIGTLGGYSTIWLARALPREGRLITLEVSPKHAEVARANIAHAGLAPLVDLRIGPALESLKQLQAENTAPFDLIFIDADKANNPNYLEAALNLSHPGTIILTDNVIREGAILEANSDDPAIQGTRRMFDILSTHPRLDATALQTVGVKTYDGFALARVRD